MDIEGMESRALLGMTHLFENIRLVWQIERHCHINNRYVDGGFDFNRFCVLNYTIYDENFKIIRKFDMLINYFIFPNERLPKNLIS